MFVKLLFLLDIYFVVIDSVDGNLTVKPSDLNVTVGQSAEFHCSTDFSSLPVTWHCTGQCSPSPGEPLHLYLAGGIVDRFVGSIDVVPATDGWYDLVIYNVTELHSGVYTCGDESGAGMSASAALVVHAYPQNADFTDTTQVTPESSQQTVIIVTVVIVTVFIATIVFIIFCCRYRRKYPQNLVIQESIVDENKSLQPLINVSVSPSRKDIAYQTSLTEPNATSQSTVGGNGTSPKSTKQLKTQENKNAPSSAKVLDASIQCHSEFIRALEELDNRTASHGGSHSLENLADFFARNFAILDMLTDSGCLSYDEKRKIEIKDMTRVVDIMMKRSTDDLKQMVVCCQQHKRDDAANLLTEVIHERRSSISMGFPLLRYILETRFHFRQKLCEGGVLTEDEASDVLMKPTAYEQSDQILHCLNQKPDKRQEFLNVLEDTNQSHVIKYMQSSTTVGDDRPLGLPQLLLITNNFQKLVGLMHPSPAFIDSLVKEKYFTFKQQKYIEKSNEFDEKNRKLLDMLTRRSVADFNKFITLLRKNEQTEAADILSGVTRNSS